MYFRVSLYEETKTQDQDCIGVIEFRKQYYKYVESGISDITPKKVCINSSGRLPIPSRNIF